MLPGSRVDRGHAWQTIRDALKFPMSTATDLPVLALVGRPNVGKSTLFNRLSGTRKALVAPVAGVTRDRREQVVRRDGYAFTLVDTGGMSFSAGGDFAQEIVQQITRAVASASALWLVLDARAGVNPYDAELHRLLLKSGKPLLVVINKAEDMPSAALGEFFQLGGAEIFPLSALHGRGVNEALEATARLVPGMRAAQPGVEGAAPAAVETDEPGTEEALAGPAVRVAFVGRPNVGKSSLINRILGRERFIVSAQAGTTREALEVPFTWQGEPYLLVDTAGIRRKARTVEYLEKLSVVNALSALERVDVAVLVVDAAGGAADQDARIAGHILERRRALVVAFNKWDLLAKADQRPAEEAIRETLRFVDFAPHVRLSASTGEGLDILFKGIRKAYQQFTREVQTADLNRVLRMTVARTSPPPRGKSPSRIFYGAQFRTAPPGFRFFTNHPEQIRESYTRFMEHQLRYHFGFQGTPLIIDWRGRKEEAAQGAAPRKQTRVARASRTSRVSRVARKVAARSQRARTAPPRQRTSAGRTAGPKRKARR